MYTRETLETKIYNLDKMSYIELGNLTKVLQSWKENAESEDIMEIGYNEKTGYVYISFESNGVQIACRFNEDVKYLATDRDTGDEYWLTSWEDCVDTQGALDKANEEIIVGFYDEE